MSNSPRQNVVETRALVALQAHCEREAATTTGTAAHTRRGSCCWYLLLWAHIRVDCPLPGPCMSRSASGAHIRVECPCVARVLRIAPYVSLNEDFKIRGRMKNGKKSKIKE